MIIINLIKKIFLKTDHLKSHIVLLSHGEPSEIARKVSLAFIQAASEEIATQQARGYTIVGEENGEWKEIKP